MKEQQDAVDKKHPICPVCREAIQRGGCIHMATEALAIWEARRG